MPCRQVLHYSWLAAYVIPLFLKHEDGFDLVEPLQSAYLQVGDDEFEIDLLGKASKGGVSYTVVGEAKIRVYPREMRQMIDRNRRIATVLAGSVVWILYPRRIHPQALAMARESGIRVIPWDYQYRNLAS